MNVTREEFFTPIAGITRKIEVIQSSGPRFLTRAQVVREIGETELRHAISIGIITPAKGRSKNSRILIERSEYEAYIQYMKR